MINLMPSHVYVLIGIGVIVALLLLLRVLRIQWRLIMFSTVGMAFVVALGGFILRSTSRESGSMHSVQDMLSNGKPTFVEFFNTGCQVCSNTPSAADSVIASITSDFNILQVDSRSEIGRELRNEFHFSDSPAFALFDAQGQEVWRAQQPPSVQELSLALNTPIAPGKS